MKLSIAIIISLIVVFWFSYAILSFFFHAFKELKDDARKLDKWAKDLEEQRNKLNNKQS
jgi:hypothetical protein